MIKKLLFFLLIPFYGFGQLCSDEDTVLLQRATTVGYTTATLTGTPGGSSGVSWAVKYVRSGHTDTITTSFTASVTKNLTGLYSGVQYKFRYLTFCGSTTQGNLGYGSFNTTTTEVQYTPMTAPGYQFKYLKADSGIAMPIRDTSTGRGTTRPGPFVINSADSMPYFWNGVYWKPFALDSAGLQAQINLKVDSVTVSGDSLFYWVNGTGYGQVITGLNAVTLQEVFDTETGTAVMNKDNTIDASLYNFTINSDSLKASGALRLTGYGTGGHTGTGAYYLRVDSDGKVIEENPTITIPLSSLTAATASNTINNANHTQSWAWNSRTGVFAALNITSNSTALSGTFPILKVASTGSNVNSGKTATAAEFSSANTGTSSTNIGLITSAYGATNNYGLLVTAGNVGIGTNSPTHSLEVSTGTIYGRWQARVGSTTSSATPTINTDNVDIYKLTAQTADITSFTTNLSGTPNDGDILEIQITGTATRAITWGSSFVSSTVTLPTTTTGTATLTVILQYYTTSSYGNNKWVCVNYY